MKLLILTQKVDQEDTVLGFFHGWVREFAAHCEEVTVIALGVGEYQLPDNVRVFSLGKEGGESRIKYLFNFYRYIFRERNHYDAVFVHMNQEYVLLGGIFWRLLGKRIFLWRNHRDGDFLTDLAVSLSSKTYATSPQSYVKQQHPEETRIMPVGVDTEQFAQSKMVTRDPRAILFFGRISPIKRVELFLEVMRKLKERGVVCVAHIVGDPANEGDSEYLEKLRAFIAANDLSSFVTISPGVPNNKAPELYSSHGIMMNFTVNGSFDKTIIEAMACETLVLTTNDALSGEVPELFLSKEADAAILADRLEMLLALSETEQQVYGKKLRDYVIEKHSLRLLAQKLFS